MLDANENAPAGNSAGTTDAVIEDKIEGAAAVEAGAGEAAKPATTEKAATLAEGAGVDDKAAAAVADWPDDWREKLAGGDDKMLARLKRFSSPANVVKSWRELETKVSSGELKRQPGKDATPEQMAEWRKENGLPENEDGYSFDLGGFIPSEADKPILDNFKKLALEENLTPAAANKMVNWYYQQQEAEIAARAKADQEYRINATVELRGEWGNEFKANINGMNNFLAATMPEGFKEQLFGARLANGRLLGDDPVALRWLADLSRQVMPGAELVPAGTPNVGQSVEGRMKEIESVLANDPAQYYSSGMDQEYLKLISAKERMGRAA